ncbi:hypothetical protein MLD38_026813 [Melastoma candidum]|uniref:Uncharacterized protein n=1 Tax=Melastoma candidum TaxID=119954 RepID=A0ACB9P383_9MYRT|nr:hypothetical protein MLD38_026813 [Melastoma candidum]
MFGRRIPDNFIKKLRDELSAVSTLNVPDSHVRHMGIKKVDNRFWFHEGGIRALPNAIVQAGGIKFRNGEDGVSFARKKRKSDLNQLISGSPPDEDSSYASASTRKRTVTTEERERAMNAAKMYKPLNPCCLVVVWPSYLYRSSWYTQIYLPSCFAEKQLSRVSGHIKLQNPDGRQWSVRCLYRGGRARLSQGWYDFSLQNNLAEGDVCVFELIKAREGSGLEGDPVPCHCRRKADEPESPCPVNSSSFTAAALSNYLSLVMNRSFLVRSN